MNCSDHRAYADAAVIVDDAVATAIADADAADGVDADGCDPRQLFA